jgi:MYXO-CTERM domain-containing protein
VLYDDNCGFCHGDFDVPPQLAPQKVLGARGCSIDGSIYGTSVFPGGVPEMQFLQGLLNPAEIAGISSYLNSRPVTGQERYLTACAGCHGQDGSGGRTGEDVRGEDAKETEKAIEHESEMRFLQCLPGSDIDSIGGYLETLSDDDHSASSSAALSGGAALLQGANVSGLPQCIPEPGPGLLAAAALAAIAVLRRSQR